MAVRRVLAAALATAWLALRVNSAEAAPRTKRACVEDSETAQRLRDERKLLEAREALVRCADEQCPEVVRRDCAEWMRDIEGQVPTVVFSARDAQGNDLPAIRVLVDGVPLAERIDGKSVAVDPGEHVIRFEADPPIEKRVVIREGERSRVIGITVPAPAPPDPMPQTLKEEDRPRTQTERDRPAIPLLTWVFGGIAVAGGAGFAFLWWSATSEVDEIRRTCYPRCSQADVSGAETKALVADVALGIGITSAVAAATVFLLQPKRSRSSVGVSASPQSVGFSGTF